MSQRKIAALAGIVLATAATLGASSLASLQRDAVAVAPMTSAGCASVPVSVPLEQPGTRRATTTAWHNVSAEPQLQYALVWNVQFRSYEIVWRNRGERDMHFRFAADSVGTKATRVRQRVLPAGITESLPGEAFAPSKETGVVCVQVVARRSSAT